MVGASTARRRQQAGQQTDGRPAKTQKELTEASWIHGVSTVMRVSLLALCRITKMTSIELEVAFDKMLNEVPVQILMAPLVYRPSGTWLMWQLQLLAAVPQSRTQSAYEREADDLAHMAQEVIAVALRRSLLPLQELVWILDQTPPCALSTRPEEQPRIFAAFQAEAVLDLYWAYGHTDFPGMHLSRAPTPWLDREQQEARACQHTPAIDCFLSKVTAAMGRCWSDSPGPGLPVDPAAIHHLASPSCVDQVTCQVQIQTLVGLYSITGEDTEEIETKRLTMITLCALEGYAKAVLAASGSKPSTRECLTDALWRCTESLKGCQGFVSLLSIGLGLMCADHDLYTRAALPAIAGLYTASIAMHMAEPSTLYSMLRSVYEGQVAASAEVLKPHITACLRGLLAAMADGRVQGHACIAAADFQAAAASVRACIPALAAGTTHVLAAADQVTAVAELVAQASAAAKSAAWLQAAQAAQAAQGKSRAKDQQQQQQDQEAEIALMAADTEQRAAEAAREQQAQERALELIREEEAEAQRSQQQADKKAAKKARQKQRKQAAGTPAEPAASSSLPQLGIVPDIPDSSANKQFLRYLAAQLSYAPPAPQAAGSE